ncbi:hypothetical protein MFFC18_22530 [Mariniblastus fucicola]|uniref:Uncharacterized protein n=1 Tax=Mariniblastus fucicola TaxID=980251 RepID=A0A5B9PIC0_9BACT|nr:hypothetical protein MFFC18_22530 [Mariniblastus fucicola]
MVFTSILPHGGADRGLGKVVGYLSSKASFNTWLEVPAQVKSVRPGFVSFRKATQSFVCCDSTRPISQSPIASAVASERLVKTRVMRGTPTYQLAAL